MCYVCITYLMVNWNMEKTEELILLSLLDGPKSGAEIIMLVAPERCPQEQGRINHPDKWPKKMRREVTMSVMSNWFRKGSKSGYMHNLEKRGLLKNIRPGGGRERKYDVNWLKLSKLMWDNIPASKTVTNLSTLEKTLAERMEKNRDLLFNLDAFQALYHIDDNLIFPSLRGFIHSAMGYSFVLNRSLYLMEKNTSFSVKDALNEVKEMKFESVIRFLVQRVWKELTNEPDREFEKRELIFLGKQKSKAEERDYDMLKKGLEPGFLFYLKLVVGNIVHREFDVANSDYENKDWIKAIEDISSNKVKGKVSFRSYPPLFKGIRIPITKNEKKELEDFRNINKILDRKDADIMELLEKGFELYFYEDKVVVMEKQSKGNYELYKSPFDLEDFEVFLDLKNEFI